jgi:hypothetical protein
MQLQKISRSPRALVGVIHIKCEGQHTRTRTRLIKNIPHANEHSRSRVRCGAGPGAGVSPEVTTA